MAAQESRHGQEHRIVTLFISEAHEDIATLREVGDVREEYGRRIRSKRLQESCMAAMYRIEAVNAILQLQLME